MRRRITAGLAFAAFASLAGCSTPGFLYTDITLPLTRDMSETPRAFLVATGSQSTLREPFTRAGIRAEWAGFAPGETARKGGIDVIHYADIRQESVFGGLWGRSTARIYGSRFADAAPSSDADPAGSTPPEVSAAGMDPAGR